MKKNTLSLLMILMTLSGYAQKKVTLTIKHLLGTSPFVKNMASKNDLNKDFKITRMQYYISQISIIHDGGKTTAVPNKYLLVDASTNVNEELGTFAVTSVEGVDFYIGVEAPTNNADPGLWPSTHPLSFQAPSMHWGWSSGYRFIAIEGDAGTTFGTHFEMHGLGNSNYHNQSIMAAGVNSGSNVTINLDADYVKALKGINVALGPIDHGADATDRDAIINFRDHVFSPGLGLSTSIANESKSTNLSISPNPSRGQFHLNMGGASAMEASIIDVTGKEIKKLNLVNKTSIDFNIEQPGFYILKVYQNEETLWNQKLLVQ